MLELGHRHIAFITAMMNSANAIRLHRLQGVLDVYEQEMGCTVQVFTRDHSPQEEMISFDIEQRVGYELALKCLDEGKPVSGFVGVNDFIAYGMLDAITSKGFRVPEDYSVCGFNNLPSSRISHIGLTSVEHQAEARARTAFNILFERIKGNSTAGDAVRVEYRHLLLERSSTAPCQRAEAIDQERGYASFTRGTFDSLAPQNAESPAYILFSGHGGALVCRAFKRRKAVI